MRLGIDLEQYAVDPQSSGIQRVLQQLARHWPSALIEADFVIPSTDGSRACFALLSPQQAEDVVSLAFDPTVSDLPIRERVATWSEEVDAPRVDAAQLMALYDAWLLPEVSYLPSVLERTRAFRASMPTTMIAYDVLPMIEPANYRFVPGSSAAVSEYFRLLADADALVCISEWTFSGVLSELRRDPTRPMVIAAPGADHVAAVPQTPRNDDRARFLRVGTLEDRKQPLAILDTFTRSRNSASDAELIFVGRPSASHAHINDRIQQAANDPSSGVTWVKDASDDDVWKHMAQADVFLSVGIEGFGIPVLESMQLGTPVVYSGIQPAAELMEGKGSRRIENLDEIFRLSQDNLAHLRSSIDASAIPRWEVFARAVADAVIQTLP